MYFRKINYLYNRYIRDILGAMVGLDRTCSKRMSEMHRQVLFLLSKGLRNSELAKHLGKSERTVKGYVSELLLIFDVTNRTELVGLLAQENPLLVTTADAFFTPARTRSGGRSGRT